MNTALTPRLPFVAALSIGLLMLVPFAQAQQPGVQAESGSVAVGRDIRDFNHHYRHSARTTGGPHPAGS